MKRKPITPQVKIDSLIYWAEPTCPECGEHIFVGEEIEWDHMHALCHGGADHYSNIHAIHATCHTQKTIRDVKANAKVKRIIKKRNGTARPKRKIPAKRDFKWPSRKMMGRKWG